MGFLVYVLELWPINPAWVVYFAPDEVILATHIAVKCAVKQEPCVSEEGVSVDDRIMESSNFALSLSSLAVA